MAASSSPSTLNPLATPFKSTRSPADAPPPLPPPPTDPASERLFHTLSTYPFHQDADFQSGLCAILGHPNTPASSAEVEQNADLVLKVQCFYFARQNNLLTPIDPTSYKSWLRLRDHSSTETEHTDTPHPLKPSTDESNTSTSAASQSPPPPQSHPPSSSQSQTITPPPLPLPLPLPSDPPPPQPRFPTTFNHIVDLITRNQPVPGIESIPNIVLGTQNAAPNTVPARRKPWETPSGQPPGQPPGQSDNSKEEDEDEDEDDKEQLHLPPPAEAAKPFPSEKPLYGGLLGPLKRVDESSDVKPIPVQTVTPSWQEMAEEGISGHVAQ